MKNVTKELVCAAFDSELEVRYLQTVKYVAKSVASMQEVPGLHSDGEIKGYTNGAIEALALAFDKTFSEVDDAIMEIADEIMSSNAYMHF